MKTINVSIKFKSKYEAFLEIFTWMSLSLGRKQNLPINGCSNSIDIPLRPAIRKACLLLSKCFILLWAPNSCFQALGLSLGCLRGTEMFKLYAWNYQRTSSIQFSTVFPAAGMQQWLFWGTLLHQKWIGTESKSVVVIEFSSSSYSFELCHKNPSTTRLIRSKGYKRDKEESVKKRF